MRRRFAFVLLIAVTAGVHAQMDMLPQLFRDLPPELQEGVPEEMSFVEYRQLNRNVDFFTMFMSIFLPGYGCFQVERPDLAWPVLGVRVGGTALMGVAVARQWNQFQDLASVSTLDDAAFRQALTNLFLFGGGVVVNGIAWAADVTIAYHVAKNERDLVQYSHGIRTTISREVSGGAADVAFETYLRNLLTQDDDARLTEELLESLSEYIERFPETVFAGEALYYLASIHEEEGADASALAAALRALCLYPGSPRETECARLVARVSERNLDAWALSPAQVLRLAALATSATPGDAEALTVVEELVSIAGQANRSHAPDMREAALREARTFVARFPKSDFVPDALVMIAETLRADGQFEDAAGYYAAAIVVYPEWDGWNDTALDLAELYSGRLNDRGRAQIVRDALAERSAQ